MAAFSASAVCMLMGDGSPQAAVARRTMASPARRGFSRRTGSRVGCFHAMPIQPAPQLLPGVGQRRQRQDAQITHTVVGQVNEACAQHACKHAMQRDAAMRQQQVKVCEKGWGRVGVGREGRCVAGCGVCSVVAGCRKCVNAGVVCRVKRV